LDVEDAKTAARVALLHDEQYSLPFAAVLGGATAVVNFRLSLGPRVSQPARVFDQGF
jgi:hypothetical protein